MTRSNYIVALHEALSKAGMRSTWVPGENMTAVAMHLPTEVLRAVINREVMYGENDRQQGAVLFHMGWAQACDDELTDRILTENL